LSRATTHGVPTEAELGASGLVAVGQLLPQLAPADQVVRRQVGRAERRPMPGRHRRDHAHGAADDQGRRGVFAAGCAPLVVARRAEELLQVIVGARHIGDVMATNEPGAGAGRHLEKVVDGRGQAAGRPAFGRHLGQQRRVPRLHLGAIPPLRVGQEVGGSLDPAIRVFHGRPQRCRRTQPGREEPIEARQRRREPPFCWATR